jgi:hypothetical protein
MAYTLTPSTAVFQTTFQAIPSFFYIPSLPVNLLVSSDTGRWTKPQSGRQRPCLIIGITLL